MPAITDEFGSVFDDFDLDTPEGLSKAIQAVVDTVTSLINVTTGMVDSFKPVVTTITGVIGSFNELSSESQKSVGNILGIAKQITMFGMEVGFAIIAIKDIADDLAGPFDVVIKTVSGTFSTLSTLWNGIKLLIIEVVDDMLAASKYVDKIIFFGKFSDDIDATRNALSGWKDDVKKDMFAAADSAVKNLTGIQTNFKALGDSATDSKTKVSYIADEIDKLPGGKKIDVTAEGNKSKDLDDLIKDVRPLLNDVETTINADINTSKALEDFFGDIDDKQVKIFAKADVSDAKKELAWFDADGKKHTILVDADTSEVKDAKKEVEELPTEKMMEIKLQGEIDKEIESIKSNAETVQAAMEWQAKLDVSEMEAETEKTVAAFESIGESVASLSESTASMFGDLLGGWDNLSFSEQNEFFDLLENQQNAQNELINAQKELAKAQTDYLNAKTDVLESGGGQIRIDGTGLSPALELVFWEIIEKVQARANEEAGEFLLGI